MVKITNKSYEIIISLLLSYLHRLDIQKSSSWYLQGDDKKIENIRKLLKTLEGEAFIDGLEKVGE